MPFGGFRGGRNNMTEPTRLGASRGSPDSVNGAPDAPSAAEVRIQLERIVSTPLFATSESLKGLVRFIVERTLEGRGDELKEYLLGVEVFRRGAQFDPRLDSIVRVQGSKVRAKLREYYETLGENEPVRIELPKGTYVPVFRTRGEANPQTMEPANPSAPVAADKRTQKLVLFIALVLAAITFTFVYIDKHRLTAPPIETKLLQLTYDSGLTTDPALSPDGKLVAYVSDRSGEDHLDLWLQPAQGGASLQLTYGPADVREPAFSPDGSSIVFRSDHDPGGLYVISVLGGEPRRIAPKGRRPRFSPDGKQIVYWDGQDVYGALYVLSVSGVPQRVAPEFNHATFPLWTPDGKHLLFWGNRSETYKDIDWWVVPLAGGDPVKTGLAAVLAQHQLEPDVRSLGDWMWFQDSLILSARQADSTNLWKIPISPSTFRITGDPQRLTFGAGQDVLPSIASDGRIVFATLRNDIQVWSLPVDVDQRGAPAGLQPLTTDAVAKAWPSISADGRYLVFTASRGGRQEIWLRDVRTGQERTLTPSPAAGIAPVITHDGSEVAFGPPFPRRGEKIGLYTVHTQDGVPGKICEECGYPSGWSHDKTKIVYNISPYGNTSWFDRKSGEKHLYLHHPVYAVWDGIFSPDDRWLAFTAVKQPGRNQIFIAPFPEGAGSDEHAWIPITDGIHADSHVEWARDGRSLYFLSDRDGSPCLWAQPLDPTMIPKGPLKALLHLHRTKRSIRNVTFNQFTLTAAQGRLVFNLGELNGNIWMTYLNPR
jgi:Tol biopolymer transport system component